MKRFLFLLLFFALSASCRPGLPESDTSMEYARWFDLKDSLLITRSPFDGQADTLPLKPVRRMVCMSTSYVGYLGAIGRQDVVCGVSGLGYVSDSAVRRRSVDVGYDAAMNYEAILALKPDLVVTYLVSGARPPYLDKLRDLGVPVLIIHEHLEEHPLSRAEYVRLFGALTGERDRADSLFRAVRDRYLSLCVPPVPGRKVLLNIPYADQWYIPGADNYLSRLIRDAGGEVLGAVSGSAQSSVISLEEAFRLSSEADFWLHTGWCNTRAQLKSIHPLVKDFPVLLRSVYNNTLRRTPEGGNDFWESGAARPDLLLEDLRHIFDGDGQPLTYYQEVL